MTDYWFAPVSAIDPDDKQPELLGLLFTLRRPPPSVAVHQPNVLVNVRDLIAELNSLAPTDLNNVLLGSHATLDAQIYLEMYTGQVNPINGDTNTDYEILASSLTDSSRSVAFPPSLFADPAGFIHFRGCNTGKYRPLMLKMKEAFGGVHDVTAPKHFHVITKKVSNTDPTNAGVGVFEHMSYAFRTSTKVPFTTRQQLITSLLTKGYRLIDGTLVDAPMYNTFMKDLKGVGPQKPEREYRLGETLAENTKSIRIPTQLKVKTKMVDHDAIVDPFPTDKDAQAAAFKENLTSAPYLDPGYPVGDPDSPLAFPFYKRLSLANAVEYHDVHAWKITPIPAESTLRGSGTRHDYELRVPIFDSVENRLVFNFFPVFGSTDPAITYLHEGDSSYFGNTSLPV